MGLIQFDRPWQPPLRPRLRPRWGGVAGTALLGADRLALDGQPVVGVGASSVSATPFGSAASFAVGTNMLRATIRSSAIGTDAPAGAALLGVFRTLSTATDGRLVSLGSDAGASGNTIFSIGINGSALRVTAGGSATTVAAEASAVGINDGRLHCVVLTLDAFNAGSNNFYAWLDGRRVVSSSVTTPGASSLYSYIVANGFRRGGTDSAGIAGDVLLAVPFYRRLSDEEAQELSTVAGAFDSLFAPRRIWVPTAAAGGNVTANGVTLRAAARLSAGGATAQRNVSAAGASLRAAARLAAGGATTTSNATAAGASLRSAARLAAGGAAAQRNVSAAGASLRAAARLNGGGAFIPGVGTLVRSKMHLRIGLGM